MHASSLEHLELAEITTLLISSHKDVDRFQAQFILLTVFKYHICL